MILINIRTIVFIFMIIINLVGASAFFAKRAYAIFVARFLMKF